jgi:hypothetical protein
MHYHDASRDGLICSSILQSIHGYIAVQSFSKMPSIGSQDERFPEIFHPTNIDRRGRRRTVEMKVLVIGMMRTGTMCMSQWTLKIPGQY